MAMLELLQIIMVLEPMVAIVVCVSISSSNLRVPNCPSTIYTFRMHLSSQLAQQPQTSTQPLHNAKID